ncbi:MAG: TonB-dependent receptor [Cyclobacteriaceae bacterium]
MRYILILFLLFSSEYAIGQSSVLVSGQVVDSVSKENIPFASVSLLTKDGNLVNGTITREDGRFTLDGLIAGSYILRISFIGYTDSQSEILIGKLNNIYNYGKIELVPSATELEGVTVKDDRLESTEDMFKRSLEMSDNIAQSGGSVMDAMKAMPGVTFDQEGKVILRGSDKVVVLIDGKQSSLTGYGNQKGLDNIPSANIERIDIINNPSSKYDANGMAGVVNIIYKKERQEGWNVSGGMAVGFGALSRRKKDTPTDLGSFTATPKYIPSLDLNYKKEKINVFLQSEVLFLKKLPNNEFTTRYYDDGRSTISQVPENRRQTHYIVKGGLDYHIDANNILTFSGIYDWETHVDTAQVAYINLLNNTRNRYINWNEEEVTGFMNYTLGYEHKFKQPGHLLNSRIQYTKGWEDETYFINDSTRIRSQGRDVTNILATEHITSFNIDYIKPLRSGRLEIGSKLQARDLPVDYTQQRGNNSILYSGLGNYSDWGETIYAGYINWVHEKPKYEIEGGLRAEHTLVHYDMDPTNTYYQQNDKYDYFKLFPNTRVSYKFNELNKISLYYSNRVDRPGEPELRMFSKSDDHELVKVGNPYLRPQFTESVEIGYKTVWDKGSFLLSGYLRNIDDPFMRVYTQDQTNTDFDVVLKSYANTGRATNKGIEVIYSQEINDHWKFSGNMNIYQNKIFAYTGTLLFPNEHQFMVEESVDNTMDIKLTNSFKLSNDYEIQLTSLYLAAKNIPQGRQASRSSLDFGIKKKAFNGRGEIILAATDIFNRYGIRYELKGDGFDAVYENYYETQTVRIGLKYKF